MKRIFYYTHKLLAPSLFAISLLLIINSFITDEPFSKLGLVLAILTLLWLGKNQTQLSLSLTSRKLIDSNPNPVSHKAVGNDINWNFNSHDYNQTNDDYTYKSNLNSKNQVLQQDINDKKHIKNYPKQFVKQHGIEVAQLENNSSYDIANKAIFPN